MDSKFLVGKSFKKQSTCRWTLLFYCLMNLDEDYTTYTQNNK